MSRLNAGASEFVPGRGFRLPQQNPLPPPPSPPAALEPIERPTLAPRTIATEKTKTDTNVVAQDIRAVADESIVKDLYGDGLSVSWVFVHFS
jgi:peptide chain release factor subunit 3